MCGRDSEAPPVSFTWRANVHTPKTVLLSVLFTALALLAAHLYSRWVVVEFTTFHRWCPDCQRRHRSRSIVVGAMHKVPFAVLMLLLFLTVPLVIFLFVMPFTAPEGTRLMLAGSVVGVGLLALVVWGFETCRRSLIPPSLRQIRRFAFFPYGLRKTAYRRKRALSGARQGCWVAFRCRQMGRWCHLASRFSVDATEAR